MVRADGQADRRTCRNTPPPNSAGKAKAATITLDEAGDCRLAHAARTRARRDRRHPLRARKGPQPHRHHGRRAARLGALAASAPGACRSRCSSTARAASIWSIRRSTRASSRRSASDGVDAWDEAARAGIARHRLRRRRLRAGHRHPRRLVRFRARPMPSCSKAALARPADGPPTSISKAATSIAAGSSRACSKAAARAAARPTRRC